MTLSTDFSKTGSWKVQLVHDYMSFLELLYQQCDLKTTDMYSLAILEAGSQKSRSAGPCSLRTLTLERNLSHAFLSASGATSNHWHPLACGCISASVITWYSPYVSISVFLLFV